MNTSLQNGEHYRSFHERVVGLAMFILALNVAVLVLFIVGWLAGWFEVSVDRNQPARQWRLQVALNTGEVADDVEETVEDTQRTAASLQAATELDTVIGNVVQNDAANHRLTVRTEKGEQVTAHLNEATKAEADGQKVSPEVFRQGDRIELTFREQDGQNHAVQIARLE